MTATLVFSLVFAGALITAASALNLRVLKPNITLTAPNVTLSTQNRNSTSLFKPNFKLPFFKAPNLKFANLKDFSFKININIPPPKIDNFNVSYVIDSLGNLQKIDIEKALKEPLTFFNEREDIRFELFTPKNPKESQIISHLNATSISKSNFNKKYPTRILIHGWYSLGLLTPRFADAYFEKGKHKVNFIAVNWQKGGDTINYILARNRVKAVGKVVAELIDFLVEKSGMKLQDVTLIGHSLGAHVSGIAGKHVINGKIAKIVGLDPASPLFSFNEIKNRLDATDAEYVEIIHTCAGTLGFSQPLGNASFFPNGGSKQPGCGWDMSGVCAHGRAYEYYIESLFQSNFLAFQCDSLSSVQKGTCTVVNHVVEMGGEPGLTRANGIFYLKTNDAPMFARDDETLRALLMSSKSKWYIFWKYFTKLATKIDI